MKRWLLGVLVALATGCSQPAPTLASSSPQPDEPAGQASVAGEDPRMLAAIEEARKRYPEFADRYQAGAPGEKFYVKAVFQAREGIREFMWVRVSQLQNDEVRGILENEPVEVADLKFGDKVSVKVADVADWCIYDQRGEVILGQFTVRALDGP